MSGSQKLFTSVLVVFVSLLVGCQAVQTAPSAPAPMLNPSILLNPSSANIGVDGTMQFTATVQNISNTTVIWSVDGVGGGNSTVGTITATGMYTAPAQPGSHTVTAASMAQSSLSAQASVAVGAVSLSPASALIAPAGTQQFTATIQGFSNTAVTWSVDGIGGGSSSTGTISSSGLYSAPAGIGPHTVQAASSADPAASASAALTVINASQNSVLTYHNDDARDGAYLEEMTLTPTNVNSNQFGKLLAYPVDGQIYGQPLYLPQISLPTYGTRDVVYVATQNNSVYAFDADATSGQATTFWQVNLGPSVPKHDDEGVSPNVGILSTPVIDASTNTIYLVAEIAGTNDQPFRLHALDATTGAERPGSPVTITATDSSGGTLSPACYQRMGLALSPVTNRIYIPFGSCPNGWVVAYDKTTLAQAAAFDATPGASGGGFWAGGGAPAIDDITGDLYLMSGTDSGDQQWITGSTQVGYNDSFLRLDPNNLSALDSFSPDNSYFLAENDADLGSGGNILVPGSSSYPNEVLGGGKDGNVFVVNRDNMGGFNDKTNNVLQTVTTGPAGFIDSIFSTPVYWNGFLYYHNNQDYLRAYSWNAAAGAGQQMSAQSTSQGPAFFQMHGATASLSANGTTNGIVWDIDNSNYDSTDPSQSGACVLHAYDATNVATELYNSAQASTRDTAGQALKFTVPTIANGRVFLPTANELDIYGLLQ